MKKKRALTLTLLAHLIAISACAKQAPEPSNDTPAAEGSAVIIVPKIKPTPYKRREQPIKHGEQPTAKTRWTYKTSNDSMSGKLVVSAQITSTNHLDFSFPYEGITRAHLIVRNHPRYGRDIILSIDRGQIDCHITRCSALLRFDDNPPMRISATSPEDHDPTTIFIGEYNKVLSALKKAEVLQIELTYFHEGNRVLVFDINGFSPPKGLIR